VDNWGETDKLTAPDAQAGEYSVTLTVTDDDGGIGGDTLLVSVGDAPFRIWIPILSRED